jgi:hypothetical protein
MQASPGGEPARGLSIPMLGVIERFFTSTICKEEGVPGLFLALLNLFILPALLLSCAYCCHAHWGGQLRLCWVLVMAHVRSTARPISNAAASGAARLSDVGLPSDGGEARAESSRSPNFYFEPSTTTVSRICIMVDGSCFIDPH